MKPEPRMYFVVEDGRTIIRIEGDLFIRGTLIVGKPVEEDHAPAA